MPETDQTKILRIEKQIERLEDDISHKLDNLQSVLSEVSTTLATLSANSDNLSHRVGSHANDIEFLKQEMVQLQLQVQNNGQITKAVSVVALVILTAVIGTYF